MIRRWLIYLAVAITAVIVYWAYRMWLSWLILVAVLCLPVAVLIFSLPAMLKLKLTVECPRWMPMGSWETLQLHTDCPLPPPPAAGKITLCRVTTGEVFKVKPGSALPADHCGALLCKIETARVYDYLGLFFLRVRKALPQTVTVYPQPVAVPCLPNLQRYLSSAWRPKPGGGFAENHELRLYRPGDSLNQIHWKLSAKMGSFIIREAMIPANSRVLLTMILRGTPEELDRKFGQLLWLSRELLRQSLRHEICVLTANGLVSQSVTDEQTMEAAIKKLLAQRPAPEDAQLPHMAAAWQYRIGGGEADA